METIYDVLRLLVSKARPMLTDAEIELAHKVIDAHEAAVPAPAKAKVTDDAEAKS